MFHEVAAYHRTEDEMMALTRGLTGASVKIGYDETGCQMFLTAERTR